MSGFFYGIFMERMTIKRQPSLTTGMRGEWLRNGAHLCYTIERPWLKNKQKVSAIPCGAYVVKKRISPKYGHHWHIQDVPGRSYILIHVANTMNDLEGCIGVGDRHGVIQGLPAVLGSRDTMAMLRATLPDEFILEVTV